jgi:divalent metal cation (Fe/Co/Zn/Cd) transporter
MKLIPESLRSWHGNLSHKSKLLYYGVLGNLSLTALDFAASLAGGQGSVVNGLHNAGDVVSYGLRSLVASDKLSEKASKNFLLGANLLALSSTGLFTIKSGVDLASGNQHLVEPSAAALEAVSSLGNFAIAGALKDDDGDHNHEDSNEDHNHAIKDGHRHAKTDAWASLIGATGLTLASATGDPRLDSAGAVVGGAYFALHMIKHIWEGRGGHHH